MSQPLSLNMNIASLFEKWGAQGAIQENGFYFSTLTPPGLRESPRWEWLGLF